MNSAAQVEKIGVAEELTAEFFQLSIVLKDGFDFVRKARQFLHEFLRGGRGQLSANLTEIERCEQKSGKLPREGFCGGNADFRASVRVDCAVRFPREHGADDVTNGENFRALLPGFAFSGESVRRLAGLADGDDEGVLVQNRVAIAELAAVVHFHGDVREALNHELARQGCMPTGAAGHNFHVAKIPELILGDIHFIEEDFSRLLRNAAEQGIAHSAGLLENLLLHEMFEATFFRHDGVPGNVLRGRVRARLSKSMSFTPWGVRMAISPSPRKKTLRVCSSSAGISLATKYSFSPRPTTIGGPIRAATIFCGSRAESATRAYAPVITFTVSRTAFSSGASFEYFSSRWAIISVSVSVWNLWPSLTS